MTVNDMIKLLRNTVEKEPYVGDFIVNDILARSWDNARNDVEPEDNLISAAILAKSKDGIVYKIIELKHNGEWF